MKVYAIDVALLAESQTPSNVDWPRLCVLAGKGSSPWRRIWVSPSQTCERRL